MIAAGAAVGHRCLCPVCLAECHLERRDVPRVPGSLRGVAKSTVLVYQQLIARLQEIKEAQNDLRKKGVDVGKDDKSK